MKAVFTIQPDGVVNVVKQDKNPDLTQLQKAVGGYIETVPYFTRFEYEGKVYKRGTAYCNENGIAEGLPFNRPATEAWKACLGKGPFSYEPHLIGNVIFYATAQEK